MNSLLGVIHMPNNIERMGIRKKKKIRYWCSKGKRVDKRIENKVNIGFKECGEWGKYANKQTIREKIEIKKSVIQT